MITTPLHLILNQRSFLAIVPQICLDRERVAVARVRERSTPHSHELILDRWILSNTPSGRLRPPMTTWAVLIAGTEKTPIDSLLERFQPKRSHQFLIIVIDPEDRSRYRAVLWHDGSWMTPADISLVGPGMTRLLASPRNEDHPCDLDTYMRRKVDEALRESRTRPALPPGVYDKLKPQRVALIGADGGGGALAPMFRSIGIRDMLIVDGDRMGLENLDRMPMVPAKGVTEKKSTLVARALGRNNPGSVMRSIPFAIESPEARERLRTLRPDLLVTFVDSNIARVAASLLARELECIHLDCGSLIQFENDGERVMAGDIRLFEPGGQGCVCCCPQMPDLDDVLADMSRPAGAMLRGPRVPWDAERAGSLYHLNALVSSLATELWISYLAGRVQTSTWIRIRWKLGAPPRIEQAAVTSPQIGERGKCRFCWL
jgi:hypothetical protein